MSWSDKEIVASERAGVGRAGEPVRIGVPCARGELTGGELMLLDGAGNAVPLQHEVLNRWSDGSAKWLLLDFPATVGPNARSVYRLTPGAQCAAAAPSVRTSPGPQAWRVETGAADFYIDATVFRPFSRVKVRGREMLAPGGSRFDLQLEQGAGASPVVDSISAECSGALRTVLRLEGRFQGDRGTSARLICRMHFFAGSSAVRLEVTLHNPRAARHPGGLWDLGDDGSLLFREFALQLPAATGGAAAVACSPESSSALFRCDLAGSNWSIYQGSSGGANWQSPIHRDREGKVPLDLPGYRISVEGREVAAGRRATPVIWCGEGSSGIAAVLPRFWQEFPKALEADDRGVKVGIFPGCSYRHELQGGEQKTTALYLDFATSPSGLEWARAPLVAFPSPRTCRNSGVFGDLPGSGDDGGGDLVDEFTTAAELLRKREEIDEYGWRNFGEIYADHEAVYHEGAEPFVSHYNNQYDLCAGLYRKFLATGDPVWGELAADLARHVLDIDIYHTDLDREEYNRGLFWHTDHYVDAGLSTHRSFSREHLQGKDPRFCGGGPGAEHCYSTGLMYHYLLTGEPPFREAVVGLAQWGLRSLSGPGTILAVAKKSQRYLQLLRSSKGSRPLFPRYPFTRGTGNVISACLDAHDLGGGEKFMQAATRLIRAAVHPGDDIQARNIADVENTWFYTVLMVSIAKYLNRKAEKEARDQEFAYARASFLSYAGWMLEHEYPYLEKPEILVYPNETWAAQDLRKSVIFYYAARYAPEAMSGRFAARAEFFLEAATRELRRRGTSTFTRPVALMLQNGWVAAALERGVACHGGDAPPDFASCSPTPHLTLASVLRRIGSEMLDAARETSLARELAWLRARM